MLNIYYGDMEEAVYNTAVYFKNTYEDNWITEPIVRDIIKDVDKSEVVSGECIVSPWLLKISENEDVTINLRHLMDFGAGRFNIKVLNTEKIVHNMSELLDEAMAYV